LRPPGKPADDPAETLEKDILTVVHVSFELE
jgi:hypothetical protein